MIEIDMTKEEEFYILQLFEYQEKRIKLVEDHMHDIAKALHMIERLMGSAERTHENTNPYGFCGDGIGA